MRHRVTLPVAVLGLVAVMTAGCGASTFPGPTTDVGGRSRSAAGPALSHAPVGAAGAPGIVAGHEQPVTNGSGADPTTGLASPSAGSAADPSSAGGSTSGAVAGDGSAVGSGGVVTPPPAAVLKPAAWPRPDLRAPTRNVTLHVPILMYHRIVDSSVARCPRRGLCVAPATFSAQLGRLAAGGWHTITMATLARDLATGTVPAPRTFVITIDDGYRDGVTNGLPVLQRLGFVATYYVVTGRLGEPDKLRPADLVRLASAGMEIGDHTVGHRNLARLPTPIVAFQIGMAAQRIESIVGEAPATFAYPFGRRDPSVVAQVASAGFGAAVIPRDQGVEDWTNRFLLPRLEVSPNETPGILLARVSTFAGVTVRG